MDKYEYKIRTAEINELIDKGEYAKAAEIADTIDWRRVRNVMMLCIISDLYKINRRYEDARDLLLLAYERRPGGRTICYSLCEISIKMEQYIQAIEYYKEFVQVAPQDTARYVLQYKLYEAQEVSLEERIAVLEEFKKRDYTEKWAYELAYLYHRVGLATRCVEECDELILWFGEGEYVTKAMELKMLHQPLNAEQQAKYDARFTEKEREEVQIEVEEPAKEDLSHTKEMDLVYEELPAEIMSPGSVKYAETDEKNGEDDEMEIHVKTMDVSEYNTINLQAELAEGLKEVLEQDVASHIEDPITRSIVSPMFEGDTKPMNPEEKVEFQTAFFDFEAAEMEESEVFFGETMEMGSGLKQEIVPEEEAKIEQEPIAETETVLQPEAVENANNQVADVTAEIVMEQLRQEMTQEFEPVREDAMSVEPPKELASVLTQQSDGQISFVVPEKQSIEKQITGQICIEDILAEWERIKKQNQEKREAEVREHVLQQTGAMFTEFEASIRDGLLEKLEREKAEELAEDAFKESEFFSALEDVSEDEVEELEEVVEQQEPTEAYVKEQTDEELLLEELQIDEYEEAVNELTEEAVYAQEEAAGETEEELWELMDEVPDELPEQFEEPTYEEPVYEEQPQPTEQPAVQEPVRERAKVRELTKEEKELFGPYVHGRTARQQLAIALDNISMAAYTGNVIVTGPEGVDILTLAQNIVREVQSTDDNFSGKMAKTTGEAMNGRDVMQTMENLRNGALIISKASGMNESSVKALYKSLQQENTGIVVVLTDTKKAMDKFLAESGQLHACFTARVDVGALSNDALVNHGKQYARTQEYAIDDLGILALHTRIEEMQTLEHSVTAREVEEIIEDAIRHVNRKTPGHFIDVLLAKRYDEEDMIILSEKDFIG